MTSWARSTRERDYHSDYSDELLERAVSANIRLGTEATLLGAFRSAAPNYVPAGRLPTATIEWLALMQHHGSPTRLLDWTTSPYVATYFAIEDVSEDGMCAVWGLNSSWLFERAGIRLGAPADDVVKQTNRVFNWVYSKDLLPVDGVALFQLRNTSSERQVIQQSAFVAPMSLGDSFEDNLRTLARDDADLSEGVRLYTIPGRWRAEVLRDLRLMNVTRATLFPGLDGFAQSLGYSLIEEDPTQRAIRMVLMRPSDGDATF